MSDEPEISMARARELAGGSVKCFDRVIDGEKRRFALINNKPYLIERGVTK